MVNVSGVRVGLYRIALDPHRACTQFNAKLVSLRSTLIVGIAISDTPNCLSQYFRSISSRVVIHAIANNAFIAWGRNNVRPTAEVKRWSHQAQMAHPHQSRRRIGRPALGSRLIKYVRFMLRSVINDLGDEPLVTSLGREKKKKGADSNAKPPVQRRRRRRSVAGG